MKWVFVVAGAAMVVIGGIGKYVDMTKYKEAFISNNSPFYTIFMTGVITVILGLSFDWIMSLDDEDEEGGEDSPEGEGDEEGVAETPEEQEDGEEATEAAEATEAPEEADAEAPSADPAEADKGGSDE